MQNLLKAYTTYTPRKRQTEHDEAVKKYAPMVYRVVRQIAEIGRAHV